MPPCGPLRTWWRCLVFGIWLPCFSQILRMEYFLRREGKQSHFRVARQPADQHHFVQIGDRAVSAKEVEIRMPQIGRQPARTTSSAGSLVDYAIVYIR